ncbi:hypothetical protein WR25_06271 [Diploscapter pachys]|uniref:Uncharacterized protein n=1 Tax=Diploscapter pachys TaxID=2018661 RepID=A0A2A2LX72_9BILA|nr:hypothetical protein WR25_06271 [Diploscapter pachys]
MQTAGCYREAAPRRLSTLPQAIWQDAKKTNRLKDKREERWSSEMTARSKMWAGLHSAGATIIRPSLTHVWQRTPPSSSLSLPCFVWTLPYGHAL